MSFLLCVAYNLNDHDGDIHDDIEVIAGKTIDESETIVSTGKVTMKFRFDEFEDVQEARYYLDQMFSKDEINVTIRES